MIQLPYPNDPFADIIWATTASFAGASLAWTSYRKIYTGWSSVGNVVGFSDTAGEVLARCFWPQVYSPTHALFVHGILSTLGVFEAVAHILLELLPSLKKLRQPRPPIMPKLAKFEDYMLKFYWSVKVIEASLNAMAHLYQGYTLYQACSTSGEPIIITAILALIFLVILCIEYASFAMRGSSNALEREQIDQAALHQINLLTGANRALAHLIVGAGIFYSAFVCIFASTSGLTSNLTFNDLPFEQRLQAGIQAMVGLVACLQGASIVLTRATDGRP